MIGSCWYYNDEIFPLGNLCHIQYVVKNYEKFGITKEEMEAIAVDYGYKNHEEAEYEYRADSEDFAEYNYYWKQVMKLVYSKGAIRIVNSPGSDFGIVCKSIKKDKDIILDLLLNYKSDFGLVKNQFYSLESLATEIGVIEARKTRKDKFDNSNDADYKEELIESTQLDDFLAKLINF